MREPLEVHPITEPEVAVLDAAYPERESRHLLRMRQQLAGEGTYFVAWSGDEPAGWVFLVTPEHASELALGGAQLSDLQVAAPYRGGGLGRALLHASEQAARDAGWDTIGLSVTSPIRTTSSPGRSTTAAATATAARASTTTATTITTSPASAATTGSSTSTWSSAPAAPTPRRGRSRPPACAGTAAERPSPQRSPRSRRLRSARRPPRRCCRTAPT